MCCPEINLYLQTELVFNLIYRCYLFPLTWFNLTSTHVLIYAEFRDYLSAIAIVHVHVVRTSYKMGIAPNWLTWRPARDQYRILYTRQTWVIPDTQIKQE